MLQDIFPLEFNNHYDPGKRADKKSLLIVMRGEISQREVLLKVCDDNTFFFPTLGDFLERFGNAGDKEGVDVISKLDDKLTYLFSIGEDDFYMPVDLKEEVPEITDDKGCGYKYYLMQNIRRENKEPQHYVFAMYTAFHLYEWYVSQAYCGKCGKPMKNDDTERARVCTCCGYKAYPRINPAVIIGVTDKESNRILLTKYRTGFAQNALVAGFTEIGETLEETVKREVMEEVGLKVTNIRYYKSQPWGIASDILAGFYCDVDGDKDIRMDESELKYAEWVAPEDIVLQTTNYSLTNEMMRLFKEKGYEGSL
ncbi:NAD(+) diphosphatase [Butyrivibrio proteoclasticus]|uniref:NAD(+) diphosphatase n=1 Tax=Butyrivibrio proteoclasticus TaxID=43305 RepID=UPI000478A1B9|nr:NAD(+) diphosphatase [Butyrivibrio proteoclasticus]